MLSQNLFALEGAATQEEHKRNRYLLFVSGIDEFDDGGYIVFIDVNSYFFEMRR